MQSGLGWKFMAGAPRPVVRPAQPQHPLQPVLELSDTAGIEAVARGFFTESPAPIAAEVNPRAHTATAAGECNQCPMDVKASKQKASKQNSSTFFHMSFKVTAKTPEQSAAGWTTLVEDSVSNYVAKHCEDGILIRAYDRGTLCLRVALRFTAEHGEDNLRFQLRTR